ncbi:MAG TPA: VCBS repeat-containing protein [Tepidisphaeraceae bacterium]|jgi:hypothetical protein|nr:VCBS repeat-containing protein [Tepidisphaeraceae bacterium]
MPTVKWTKQLISAEAFEAVAVFDVDGDGVPDIVTGGFWYKGPDFREKFIIADDLRRYRDYYDEFSVIPMDIAGDGRLDFVTGGWWGNNLRWRQNPGNHTFGWEMKPWAEHVIADGIGNVETTRAWDVDGDGQLEIVPNTPGHPLCAYKLVGPGKFAKHVLYPSGLGHGLGFGDVDGDGRPEFVTPKGILKQTGRPLGDVWELTPGPDIGRDASIPVIVADVDGDGQAELIVGNSHSYGLSWWKRTPAGKWDKQPIDPFNSQYHDLHWADIDDDGLPELVTGKRYLAHCGHDPGEYDDIGVYYFKWTGSGFAKQVISHGPPGFGCGCGIQFAMADLRGTGRLDVVAPGKEGLHVLYNEGV